MPSSEAILSGLTAIANEWRPLAFIWHVWIAALLMALLAGWRPSNRLAGGVLLLPALSVGAVALTSSNLFNGLTFVALALVLGGVAIRMSAAPVRIAPRVFLVCGAALVAFGWIYPHFLTTDSWIAYTYAAPFGLIPCPTLSMLIGITLILDRLDSAPWSITLVAAGFVYGAIGVFRLGVSLDYGLLAGAAALGAAIARSPGTWRSVRADATERNRALPGDDILAAPVQTLTHAITVRGSRREVWPWLAQMGAGNRAGWYSYDMLDNGRRPSETCIVPELQQLAIGTIFLALPGATDGFSLLAFEPERFLILGWVPPAATPTVTWAFVLEDTESGATRLIVRVRGSRDYRFYGLPWWMAKAFVRLIHFIMQRQQLLGIAARCEQPLADPGVASHCEPSRRTAA